MPWSTLTPANKSHVRVGQDLQVGAAAAKLLTPTARIDNGREPRCRSTLQPVLGLGSHVGEVFSQALAASRASRPRAAQCCHDGRSVVEPLRLAADDNVQEFGSKMVDSGAQLKRDFSVEDVLSASKHVYNVRQAPEDVARHMRTLVSSECGAQAADVKLQGKTFSQVRRELRKALARSLASRQMEAAFAKDCGLFDRPRADDIERMVASFPGDVDWSAPPVQSGIAVPAWLDEHARHCDTCLPALLDSACYFRHVHHWLGSGFDPPEALSAEEMLLLRPTKRAYVDKWRAEQAGCEAAFGKWLADCDGLISDSVAAAPGPFFPLLPVVRTKDLWRFTRNGTPYKVRLCLDLKNGGYNAGLRDWPFRYRSFDSIAENVRAGDWLATIDISRFYLRLPAGARLRAKQWFQDPASYAGTTHDNERMRSGKMRFRNLNSVAFGLKSAPAYASIISAEFARILESHGVKVAGVYVDDLLIRAETREECLRAIAIAESLALKLGIPLNDKTCGPCGPSEGITYLGLRIRTDDCTFSVTDETRQYAIDRLDEVVRTKSLSAKTLESLCGILTWVATAVERGRPRRNFLYRALKQMESRGVTSIRPRGDLLRQLQWWLAVLRRGGRLASTFWDAQPDTVLVCSDASGDDGWGACTMGLHFVGPWPASWRQSSGASSPHMLFKELVAPTLTTLLLAPFLRDKVACAALDNAGTAFTINKLSSGCVWSLVLLRALADSCHKHRLGLLGGHAHRARNQHTDALSHALPLPMWRQVLRTAVKRRSNRMEFHFAVADTATGQCFLATMSLQRPASAPATGTSAPSAARSSASVTPS